MRLPALLTLLLLTASVQAAVYRGEESTFRQPDGTPVPVRIWGDEHHARIETRDGWTLVKDGARRWCYARQGANGLEASALVFGAGDPAALGLVKHQRASRAQIDAEVAKQRALLGHDRKGRPSSPRLLAAQAARAAAAPAGAPVAAPPATVTQGDRHGITLLIVFNDPLSYDGVTKTVATPVGGGDPTNLRNEVDDYCNEIGYNGFGNNGSVYDYFYDNSCGRLRYTNVVTGIYVASQPLSYYTDPAAPFGERAQELIIEALEVVDATFDFSACDRNGDAIIDAVNCFYVYNDPDNLNDPPNDWGEGLWPHMSTFNWETDDGPAGMRATSYQISNLGATLELGTFCHENGHMLCDFPDLYDYDYDSHGGAGLFSLMGFGAQGTNPSRVDGYLALAAGWRNVIDITSLGTPPTTINASLPTQTSPIIHRYPRVGVPSEYFLFEYRSNAAGGRDTLLPCSGLAIWHVDEFGDRDEQSYVKNGDNINFELSLVQADDAFELQADFPPPPPPVVPDDGYGDAWDLWYDTNTVAQAANGLVFDDGPAPDPGPPAVNMDNNDARWWDGSASGMVIDGFGTPGATSITFDYRLPPTPPDPGPQMGFLATSMVLNEGNAGIYFLTLTVNRTYGLGQASVDYATQDLSARAIDGDYTTTSGTITWLAGETGLKTFTVQIDGDLGEERDEAFVVTLSNPQSALGFPAASLTPASSMLVALVNDDGPSADAVADSKSKIKEHGTGDSGSCGAGGVAGLLIGVGAIGLLRRRRR